MGRSNTVSASTGQNPVTSTAYDLANFKTTVTYGSADSDVVTLDPNTGRMTQYKFNVASQNATGNLTWNPNGSLGTLAITNQLNSLDTQTCSYTHDDLSRISTVGCLNGPTHRWDQTFTYDAFGNITKAVPNGGTGLSFQPTYQSSTNQITALSGCTPTTDANGQMTYDCIHNYTWDAQHKLHSVDANPSTCSTSGECLTYDAIGRTVEKAVGSTYTQIVYGPQGRFAKMNGQTLVSAFMPTPGTVVYTSASLNTTNKIAYYRHADHLGSSRLAVTPSRTLYSSTAYAPFGEAYSQSGTTDLSFTRQEQDTVSGIHDFMARNYPVNQGRWVAPDPAGLTAADPATPQSWNRYAYVINNPLVLTDPSGMDYCGGGNSPYTNGGGSTANLPEPACLIAPGVYDASWVDPNYSQAGTPGSPGYFQNQTWQSADSFLSQQTKAPEYTPLPTGGLNGFSSEVGGPGDIGVLGSQEAKIPSQYFDMVYAGNESQTLLDMGYQIHSSPLVCDTNGNCTQNIWTDFRDSGISYQSPGFPSTAPPGSIAVHPNKCSELSRAVTQLENTGHIPPPSLVNAMKKACGIS